MKIINKKIVDFQLQLNSAINMIKESGEKFYEIARLQATLMLAK